jgi:signal transduction histidine kinase
VSHEFKTPLAAIAGTVELLRDHGTSMNAEERERFLTNLTADTRRLSDLVHRVLELARADMLQPGDVRTNVAEAVGKVVDSCGAAGMKVEAVGAEQAGEAGIDGETLVAILHHLADNARRHGGQDVTLRIEASAVADARTVVIEVSDDGPGISEANRARIFDPFFTTSRDRGGTGMGLTIARALLQAHGGALELVPSDQGARFRLIMPA